MSKKFNYYFEICLYFLKFLVIILVVISFNLLLDKRTATNNYIMYSFLAVLSGILVYYLTNLFYKKIVNRNQLNYSNPFSNKKAIFLKNNKVIKNSLIVVTIVIIILTIIYSFQTLFVFIPSYESYYHNSVLNEANVSEIRVDNKSYGYQLVDDTKILPAVIYFGGNNQNSSETMYNVEAQRYNNSKNYQIFIVSYPGYNLSDDQFNVKNVYEYAEIVYKYVLENPYVNKDQIVVVGFSIGTNVATYISSVNNPFKLVLFAPYYSIRETMNQIFPMFYGPFKYLVKINFDTYKYINDVDCDIFIAYSKDDQVIKSKNTEKLIKSIKNSDNNFYLKVNYNSHNEVIENKHTLNELSYFIRKDL